jgi:hypothetical protein
MFSCGSGSLGFASITSARVGCVSSLLRRLRGAQTMLTALNKGARMKMR